MEKQTKKPEHRSGWRQWTADEGRRAVEAWRASGLPLETFARQRGVTAQRIRWWRQRLERRGEARAGGEKGLRLVPAVVSGLLSPVSAAVTLRAPGDVVVEIADVGAVPATWLAELVTGLARSAA
jgi:transposase-like protein